jgi:hypothetical protein
LTTPKHIQLTGLAEMMPGYFAARSALAIETYVGDLGTLGNPAGRSFGSQPNT